MVIHRLAKCVLSDHHDLGHISIDVPKEIIGGTKDEIDPAGRTPTL